LINALSIDRDPLKDIGKGYAKKQGWEKATYDQTKITNTFPDRMIKLSPKLKGYTSDDEGKEDEHKG
jgi:hypothetical protein